MRLSRCASEGPTGVWRCGNAKLTLAELRNRISDTKSAIHRCKEALDNLRQPKTDCGSTGNGRCDYTLVAEARTRFESIEGSLHGYGLKARDVKFHKVIPRGNGILHREG